MRIVLTRPAGRGASLLDRLRLEGHEVLNLPLTRIEDGAAFPDPSAYDGVLFTSVAAVERAPDGAAWPRVGAVGPATAEALRARKIAVEVVGGGGGADLAQAWGECAGKRLLLPQAARAHPALAEALRARGAEVDAVAVYRTVPVAPVDVASLQEADEIWFFAPSAVRAYFELNLKTRAFLRAGGATTEEALRSAQERSRGSR